MSLLFSPLCGCSPRDAARVLRKKLSPKSPPAVIVKAIAVLEVAAKNCGKRFHIHVTSKDFVAALNKLLEQKVRRAVGRLKTDPVNAGD